MEEIVKYFENIEARLAALEAAEQAEPQQDALIQAMAEKLSLQAQKLTEQASVIAALSSKVVALEAQVNELAARPAQVVEVPVAAVVEAPATPVVETPVEEVVPEVTETAEEEDIVAVDEESGLPELEVELVEEEETMETSEAIAPTIPEPEPAVVPTPAVESTPAPAAEPVSSVVPKLDSIKKGMSLADKFLFNKELFGGNMETLQKEMTIIDNMGSQAEAEAYIAQRFPHWNKESNAYELFFNLLKRRW